MNLTGRTRYRAGWFGRLVVQVEYAYEHSEYAGMTPVAAVRWRDARIEDFPPLLDPRIAEVAIVVSGSSKPAKLA